MCRSVGWQQSSLCQMTIIQVFTESHCTNQSYLGMSTLWMCADHICVNWLDVGFRILKKNLHLFPETRTFHRGSEPWQVPVPPKCPLSWPAAGLLPAALSSPSAPLTAPATGELFLQTMAQAGHLVKQGLHRQLLKICSVWHRQLPRHGQVDLEKAFTETVVDVGRYNPTVDGTSTLFRQMNKTPQTDFSVISIPTTSEPFPDSLIDHEKGLLYRPNDVGIISKTRPITPQIYDIVQHPTVSSSLSPTTQQTRESRSSSPVICGEAPGIKPDLTTKRLTRHTYSAEKFQSKEQTSCPSKGSIRIPTQAPLEGKLETNGPMVNPCAPLSCALINARSIMNQGQQLSQLITNNDIGLVCITETWEQPNEKGRSALEKCCPEGYTCDSVPRTSGRGGGLAVIYRDQLKLEPIPCDTYGSCEIMKLTVKCDNTACIDLVIIYRPPNSNFKQFRSDFSNILQQTLRQSSSRFVCLGDFNVHIDRENIPEAKYFKSILDNFDLYQHVTFPTHEKGRTLDLVISENRHREIIRNTRTLSLGSVKSDHFAVGFDIVS